MLSLFSAIDWPELATAKNKKMIVEINVLMIRYIFYKCLILKTLKQEINVMFLEIRHKKSRIIAAFAVFKEEDY